MNRHNDVVTTGAVSIETYIDGTGPDVVTLPSYGRDSGEDFNTFTTALADAGYRVLRPQPRGIARSVCGWPGRPHAGKRRACERRLPLADISMISGLIVSAVAYWSACRSIDVEAEKRRITEADRDIETNRVE
ncbi:hypothetical protein [Saccharopolyspora rosea]|uniref:Uncharacterized protein n=1 Tax=Saccharopolyspora rosea TaxID=524884 RepID=A0ABW3FTI5_9PSEU|nr:hypothetical protein [Saccharopolyspora rosea]